MVLFHEILDVDGTNLHFVKKHCFNIRLYASFNNFMLSF